MDADQDDPGGPRPNRKAWGPVLWYFAIAAFNALFYVALGAGFVALGLPPAAAGPLALLPVLTVSYLGHKSKTFRSTGPHRREAPRFVAVSIVDLLLAGFVPQAAVHARAPPVAAFVILTFLIPLANFLMMKFWIFKEHGER